MTETSPKRRVPSGGDNTPMQYMIATAASGCKDVSEFLDLDMETCEQWLEYCLRGPTEARTQILLAQLVQIVSGALGGTPTKLEKLLPWVSDITGGKRENHKEKHMKRARATAAGLVDSMVKKNGKRKRNT